MQLWSDFALPEFALIGKEVPVADLVQQRQQFGLGEFELAQLAVGLQRADRGSGWRRSGSVADLLEPLPRTRRSLAEFPLRAEIDQIHAQLPVGTGVRNAESIPQNVGLCVQ